MTNLLMTTAFNGFTHLAYDPGSLTTRSHSHFSSYSHHYSYDGGSANGGNGAFFLLLIPLVVAVLFYLFMYRRYRNQNQRDFFERETAVEVSNTRAEDNRVDHIHDTTRSHLDGDLVGKPLVRVKRRA